MSLQDKTEQAEYVYDHKFEKSDILSDGAEATLNK